jgi:hypothetical protein
MSGVSLPNIAPGSLDLNRLARTLKRHRTEGYWPDILLPVSARHAECKGHMGKATQGGIMKVKYLTEKQVAGITGRALQTLRNERFLGRGIPYVKVGRSVRYSLEDVVEFMESRKIGTQDAMCVRSASGRQTRVATGL